MAEEQEEDKNKSIRPGEQARGQKQSNAYLRGRFDEIFVKTLDHYWVEM